MKKVILRTPKQTKSNSFSDALFWTLTVAPSVGLFSKLTTKQTKQGNMCDQILTTSYWLEKIF
jgi:hypothetical protein